MTEVIVSIQVNTDDEALAKRVGNAITDFGYDSFDASAFGLTDDDVDVAVL